MLQQTVAAASGQDLAVRLTEMRAKSGELKLKLSDLNARRRQLTDQRSRMSASAADVDRSSVNKALGDVEHDIAATQIQLEQVDHQVEELQTDREMARVFSLQGPQPPQNPQPPQALQGPSGIATTAPPDFFFPDMQMARERERMIGIGAIIVLAPLALALSRRIWHRSGRVQVTDLENSPRLQRIEQAVEAIAVEVERIGEAQRFTTKLLSERQPEVAQRVASQSRREPGTITPH